MMNQDLLIEIIKSTAQTYHLDQNLVIAIAGHETNFDSAKVRYESGYKYLVTPRIFAKDLGISIETEIVLQSISWGCLQVMGAVARELGYLGHLTSLVDPESGIIYGCKKLKYLYNIYKDDEASVVAAYNAGVAKKGLNREYINQPYVTDVLNRLTQLRAPL